MSCRISSSLATAVCASFCIGVSFVVYADDFPVPVTIVGMVNENNELVRPEDRITFCSDGGNMVFEYEGAARNNDPGGGLIAKASQRDGNVSLDDNIALVFTEQPGQIIRHIALNVNGVVFDRSRRGAEKWDASWNAEGLEVVSSEARSGQW